VARATTEKLRTWSVHSVRFSNLLKCLFPSLLQHGFDKIGSRVCGCQFYLSSSFQTAVNFRLENFYSCMREAFILHVASHITLKFGNSTCTVSSKAISNYLVKDFHEAREFAFLLRNSHFMGPS
jgi:hypothetical protein